MPSQRSLEDLVREYKERTLNEREKAEYEEVIFQQATLEKVRTSGESRFDFFARYLGIPKYEAANRQALFSRGAQANPLWDHILNASMPVTTAVTLSRKASTISYNDRSTYEDALQKVLAEYDAKPSVSALRNGKIVKKSNPKRETKGRPLKAVRVKALAAPPPPPPLPEENLTAKSPRDTWRVIRQITETMLNDRMTGCDPVFIETMLRDFRLDLEALIESYQSRISRIGATHKGENLLPTGINHKEELNDACRELSLDEIEQIGDVIDIMQARKNARSFMAKFHPDKNPGKEKLFETKFRAVSKALETLETYNSQHGVKAHAGSH